MFQSGIACGTEDARTRCCQGWFSSGFSNLACDAQWRSPCFFKGMNFWLIFLAAQVVLGVIVLILESGEDKRFEGDKLNYRS